MNRTLKRRLKNELSSILEDREFRTFEYYLENDMWTSLRIFMGDIVEKYERKKLIQESTSWEISKLERMEGIVIELALGIYEDPNEEYTFNERESTRQTTSRSS